MAENNKEIFNKQDNPEAKKEASQSEIDSVAKSQKESLKINEAEKKDKEIEKRLSYMDNKEFLSIKREDRLLYITKPEKDYSKVNE
jgi:hypothetical protein